MGAMAKPIIPPGPSQAPQPGGDEEGTEFFTPEAGGYQRTDSDPGMGSGSPPPPAPPPAQPQPQPQAQPAPAPSPAPAAESPPMDMSSPKDVSKALADTVVTALVDKLKAEAEARGGHLTSQDLEAMQADFNRQAEALSSVFEQSFEVYVRARERAVWDQQRNYPFDRLMVKKFSNLFRDGGEIGPDDLSRRMLPGFFVALGMMLGTEVVEKYQVKCRGIVEKVQASGKSVFNWDDVYADEVAETVSLDAEVAIAGYFEDFDKRAEWFIELVNAHLTPPEPGMGAAAGWELNRAGLKKFLGALLTDLSANLDTDNGKMRITKRFGADTCANLFDILTKIQE